MEIAPTAARRFIMDLLGEQMEYQVTHVTPARFVTGKKCQRRKSARELGNRSRNPRTLTDRGGGSISVHGRWRTGDEDDTVAQLAHAIGPPTERRPVVLDR